MTQSSAVGSLFALTMAGVAPAAQTDISTAPVIATSTSEPCAGCIVVPALQPVRLEIMALLGSKTSLSGDRFPIRLATPIMIGDRIAVPAGATGIGEVVHAKKGGGGGAAGELVLAARYLDIAGRRLRLRSMNVAMTGNSKVNTANAIGVAGAAAPLPIGLIGLFISGGQATVAQGTLADAKTAEAFVLPAVPAAS